MRKNIVNVNTISKVGILSALSVILMLFQVPLWFAPGFYQLDLSEIPAFIGAFALGPLAGLFIEFIKVLLNLVINGTITGGVGELSNFLIGSSLVCTSALIYKYKKSMKSAIISIIVGVITMTIVGSLLNYFVMLPLYSASGIMSIEAIIGAGNALNKGITNLETFVLYATAPFNLVKGVISGLITMLLYKRLSRILHK